jgi:hypothetical protein
MNRPIRRQRRAVRRCLAVIAAASAVVVVGCGSSSSDNGTGSGAGTSANTIPVGILHSLSGTMAISEVAV